MESMRRKRPMVLQWSQALKSGLVHCRGADCTAACLQRGCMTPASALNTSLHMESDLTSLGLYPNLLMSLHASLLPVSVWLGFRRVVRTILQVRRSNFIAQSCPVVRPLSLKVANEAAKLASLASDDCCCCRSPSAGLWVLCATSIPYTVPLGSHI